MRDLLWKIYNIDKNETTKNIITKQININPAIAKSMIGVYGKLPGYLTNTRDFLDFGEFIVYMKNQTLMLKSLWGSKKKGVNLYPLDKEDPYIFGITEQLSPYTMIPVEPILFVPDSNGKINRVYFELSELIRKSGLKSLKNKILLLKIIGTLILIWIMLCVIL
jgi:hypothetical protein